MRTRSACVSESRGQMRQRRTGRSRAWRGCQHGDGHSAQQASVAGVNFERSSIVQWCIQSESENERASSIGLDPQVATLRHEPSLEFQGQHTCNGECCAVFTQNGRPINEQGGGIE